MDWQYQLLEVVAGRGWRGMWAWAGTGAEREFVAPAGRDGEQGGGWRPRERVVLASVSNTLYEYTLTQTGT